jgi:hypothetical protein
MIERVIILAWKKGIILAPSLLINDYQLDSPSQPSETDP